MATFQDVASKIITVWHVIDTTPEELFTTALQRAFWAQQPAPGLVVHSDRGGHYDDRAYRTLPTDTRPCTRRADA